MVENEIVVRVAQWEEDRAALEAIYTSVFIDEQGVPAEITWDGRETDAIHFLLEMNGQASACGRLLDTGQVGRMAVMPQQRRCGLGGKLLRFMIEQAREQGFDRLFLNAQKSAIDFYLRHGFSICGEEFIEANIPHREMELSLDAAATSHTRGVAYPEPFATLCVELVSTARRHIRIFSPSLDHAVFDRPDLASALAAVARGSRYSEVRILISDSRPIVKRGHRLLDLARRLPSAVAIQKLTEHPELPSDSFVLRDDGGTLFKPNDSDREGFYDPESRILAKPYIDKFDELWLKSRPDPELRILGL